VAVIIIKVDNENKGTIMSYAVVPIQTFASGYHAPLEIAIPVITVVVILKVVISRSRGQPAIGGKTEVKCSKGHVFKANWSSLGSFTSIRLGGARFQRCPVGNHWSFVKSVDDSKPTDND
jgi:hypothetical protein